MAIDVRELQTRPLDPVIADELDIFERTLAEYLDGRDRRGRLPRLPPEPRHLRPAPGRPQPDGAGEDPVRAGRRPSSSRCSATSRETYSRGWGHLTTRQNVQFHFVQLEQTPEMLRLLASVGLTTPRGVRRHRAQRRRLPPRRRVPVRGARHHAVGRGDRATSSCATRYAQRLPRKFKINFSGCATDCGQAMFNDVGVDRGDTATHADGTAEPGFKVFVAGGLGANPHPAQALEEFTVARGPAADDRGVPAHLRPLRQPRQQDPRPHEVARRHDGHRRAARAHPQGAQVPARRVGYWPGGIPDEVAARAATRRPAGTPVSADGGLPGREHAGAAARSRIRSSGGTRPTSCAASRQRHGLRVRVRPARRHHDRAVPAASPTSSATSRSTSASPTGRTSCCATSPKPTSAASTTGSAEIGMAEPGAELARDVVSCPGADTCNLAVTQSRGLAVRHRRRARGGGPRRGRRRAHQHLGLHEQLRPAPHLRHRLHRPRAPRARPRRARLPDAARRSPRRDGDRVRREGRASCRPRPRPKRSCGSSAGSPASATPARRSPTWLARVRRRQGCRRRPSTTSTTSPPPTRRPTSTSTTTRPVRTSPRSATASARRRDRRRPMTTLNDTTRSRPLVDVDLGELAAVVGRARAQARERGDRAGRRTLRHRARARGVVPGLRAHRRRGARPRPTSRSCSSTRSTTSRRRSGTSSRSASATT